jgi:threonine/homoserine/homoserine lactone efflux protein
LPPESKKARSPLMNLPVLMAFIVALAIAVALPGPGVFAVVSCAIGRGFRAALAMVGGIALGDLIYFCLAALGMAALARSMGEAFIAVKFAGAGYLIWLGIKLWRERPLAAAPAGLPERGGSGARQGFVAGFLVTAGNPKAIAFYAGLLPTFVELPALSAGDVIVMGGIVLVTVGSIMAGYAALAAGSRRFLASPARLRVLNRVAGTMLIGSGIIIASR